MGSGGEERSVPRRRRCHHSVYNLNCYHLWVGFNWSYRCIKLCFNEGIRVYNNDPISILFSLVGTLV